MERRGSNMPKYNKSKPSTAMYRVVESGIRTDLLKEAYIPEVSGIDEGFVRSLPRDQGF